MRLPTALDLVRVWELGHDKPTWYRGLLMLGPVLPEVRRQDLEHLTLARRNATLLALRQGLFGGDMPASVVCPSCGERLEFALEVDDFLSTYLRQTEPPTLEVESSGFKARARLPTSADVIEYPDDPRGLLGACLVDLIGTDDASGPVDAASLPDAVLEAAQERITSVDPLFDTGVALNCASCGHVWEAGFDLVEFLFAEISSEARRLLAEVDVLATAYGWSERDILSLPAQRRRQYLEMAG